jgi:hypothetical protein
MALSDATDYVPGQKVMKGAGLDELKLKGEKKSGYCVFYEWS